MERNFIKNLRVCLLLVLFSFTSCIKLLGQTTFTVDDPVQGVTFCEGDLIEFSYNSTGITFGSGNLFTVELSDPSGSFTIPAYSILTPTNNNPTCASCVLSCQVPGGLHGNQFRARVAATDCGSGVGCISGINANDLSMHMKPSVSISSLNQAFPVICFDQSMDIDANAQLPGVANPVFEYYWNSNTSPGNNSINIQHSSTGTLPKNVDVNVKVEAYGCFSDVVVQTMTHNASITVALITTATSIDFTPDYGQLFLGGSPTASGGIGTPPGFNYSWSPQTALDDPTSDDPEVNLEELDETAIYSVVVTDQAGCSKVSANLTINPIKITIDVSGVNESVLEIESPGLNNTISNKPTGQSSNVYHIAPKYNNVNNHDVDLTIEENLNDGIMENVLRFSYDNNWNVLTPVLIDFYPNTPQSAFLELEPEYYSAVGRKITFYKEPPEKSYWNFTTNLTDGLSMNVGNDFEITLKAAGSLISITSSSLALSRVTNTGNVAGPSASSSGNTISCQVSTAGLYEFELTVNGLNSSGNGASNVYRGQLIVK